MILTGRGEELVRVGKMDKKVRKYIQSEEFISQNYRERSQCIDCGSYTLFPRQISLNGEIICKIVPKISMAETFREVAYMPVFLMMGVLIGLFPVLLFMSDIVCRPLEKVCIGMDRFKQGDFEQQVEVDTEDEIGKVSSCFNMMVTDMKELIDWNYVMALHYRYLEIQKMRFLKQMDFTIEIEESIQDFKVPKLLLQPFVENAVVHGIENAKYSCVIRITGKQIGDKIEFRVQDTGVGMTEKQMENIWKKDNTKTYSSQRLGGYAIRNVKERLELQYGKDFDLRIESQAGKGTTVILLIPAGV